MNRIVKNKESINITFILIFIGMLLLNILTPMIADDYSYAFSFATGARIASIKDVLNSQIVHWKQWGGRSVAHTFVQIFMLFPPIIFDICNSLMFYLLLYLMYKHIYGKDKKVHSVDMYIISLYLWLFLPVYGQNILWMTGSINYLWTTVLVLIFLLPYRFRIDNLSNDSIGYAFLNFFFAVFAGWSNENTGASILVVLVIYILYMKIIRKEKLYLWEVFGVVGFIIGFAMLLTAPGNFVRLNEFETDVFTIGALIERIYKSGSFYFRVGVILPLILSLVYLLLEDKVKSIKELPLLLIYPIAALVSFFSMILSPTFPDRATMIGYIFSGIAIGFSSRMLRESDVVSLRKVKESIIPIPVVKGTIIVIMVLVFLFSSLLPALLNITEVYVSHKYRENYIRENFKFSSSVATVGIISAHDKHVAQYGLSDLKQGIGDWPNESVAKYFDIGGIVANTSDYQWPQIPEMVHYLVNSREVHD